MELNPQNSSMLEERMQRYSKLYDSGLFLDVLCDAQQHYGDYRQWSHLRLRIMAARCLKHMGLVRESDTVILQEWRKQRNNPEILRYYLEVIKRRRGPLFAWSESCRLLQQTTLSAEDRAYLLCDQQDIVCVFRDFSFAETLLEQAMQLYTDPWINLQTAYLYLEEDKYEKAIEHTQKVCDQNPSYRPAFQLMAHLQQLSGELQLAINVLEPHFEVIQSYSLCMQLFYLNIEAGYFKQAERCLARVEAVLFEKPQYLEKQINCAKADLLCAQQRYEEALPLLEQKNFFRKSVSDAIGRASNESSREVLDLPFIRQHHMTCAPASLSSVSTYWGRPISQNEVIDAICYDGTPAVDERRWVQQQGWFVVEFQLQFDTVKLLIGRKVPLLLSTVEPGSAHLQILVGYDQAMGTYLMRDPYHPRLQEMLIVEAEQYYAASGPRCMIMVPAENVDLLQGIHFEASQLYEKAFQVSNALDEHRRADAFVALREMIALEPEHRLTLMAHRDVSIYDQNERDVLKYTEKLLALYPDDVNLQLSKVSSLAMLGSAGEHLDYLKMLSQKENCHFLIKSRLADAIRFDHRQQHRVVKLLQSLLTNNPTHSPTLYAFAGVLWDQEKYKESYEIYRFVTCLDDKDERYAMSYFQAARYHKQTELALDFLKDRFQRFGRKSSGPAISLFNAYDSVERTREGFQCLESAIDKRADDGDLLLFVAQQYLNNGEVEHCIVLAERAKSISNVLRYLELDAMIKERQKNRDGAIACWEKVLAYAPINNTANSAKIRLLVEAGKRDAACDFIDSQVKKFPGNYNLLCLKIGTLQDNDYKERINVYRLLIENHPDDNWGYKGIADDLLLQGNCDEAEFFAKEAINVNNKDASAYSKLGDVFFAKQCFEQARMAYQGAIEISCDCVDAYEPLLQCVLDYDSERLELAFIYQQLIKQVSYGDGILHYQHLAGRWLNTEEINGFLHQVVEDRPDLWQSWRALSNGYRDQGLLDKAYTTLENALQHFPLVPDLYFAKAQLLHLMNRLQEAQEQLIETLSIFPGWAKAANKLADVLEMQGKFEQAIDHLRMVIVRSPLEVTPYAYLASLLWRVGQKENAIEEMLKAVELDPEYEWAWGELKTWCEQVGRTEQVLERINYVRQQMPNRWRLLRIQAKLQDDQVVARDLLAEYLASHPQSVELCKDYVLVLVDLKEYDTALSVCEKSRWNNDAPTEIKATNAWVLDCSGKCDQAIAVMRSVVAQNPNYYDGWRWLTIWYDKKGESNNVIECVDHCCRLYPNDSSVLTFVAEKLQAHSQEQSVRISQLLHRAFHLNPTDSYTGLTYIDDLLEKEHYADIKSALKLLKLHANDAFVNYREIQIAYVESDTDTVLSLWKNIVQDPLANEYIVNQSWQLIEKLKCDTQAVADIEVLRANSVDVVAYVGEHLAYYYIEKNGLKKFEKMLLDFIPKDEFYDRMLEGYLRTLIDNKAKISSKIESMASYIGRDIINWGLLGYLYADQGQWHSVNKWMNDYKRRSDVQAWMVYFYSTALRETGSWENAAKVMADAYALEPDNYREDIVIWYFLDRLLDNHPVDNEQFQHIELDNIAGLSRYPLAIVKALCSLNNRSFDQAYTLISPCLRECQREFQPSAGSRSAQSAKWRFKTYLKHSIKQPLLKQLFWLWRLSNHF